MASNNKQYKWTLRRGGRQEVCPQCGQRRFVPYVLSADNMTMAGPEYGRCNREQSCGYFRYPGKELVVKSAPLPMQKKKNLVFNMPNFTVNDNNSLYLAYRDRLPNLLESMALYHIGTSADGYCVFPQYDGVWMKTAKMIFYKPDGHRDHDRVPRWWHKKQEYSEYRAIAELHQCFFGQHLLDNRPNAEVRIVESEKSAVLLEAYYNDSAILWIACGGAQMLKGSIDVRVLRGRNVTLYPDNGQWANWSRTAKKYGWKIEDDNYYPNADMFPNGYDLWDCLELNLN